MSVLRAEFHAWQAGGVCRVSITIHHAHMVGSCAAGPNQQLLPAPPWFPMPTGQAIRSVEFWVLATQFLAGSAAGLTLLNNLTPLVVALGGRPGGQVGGRGGGHLTGAGFRGWGSGVHRGSGVQGQGFCDVGACRLCGACLCPCA